MRATVTHFNDVEHLHREQPDLLLTWKAERAEELRAEEQWGEAAELSADVPTVWNVVRGVLDGVWPRVWARLLVFCVVLGDLARRCISSCLPKHADESNLICFAPPGSVLQCRNIFFSCRVLAASMTPRTAMLYCKVH